MRAAGQAVPASCPASVKGQVGADVESACHPVVEIFSISAVVEIAGVRVR